MSSVGAPSGVYNNTFLRKVYYGAGCTSKALPEALSLLATSTRRAYIITGKSLATKTDVVKTVEKALGESHVGTSASIGQHSPVEDIQAALKDVRAQKADVLVAVGGGSPIDAAKAISFFAHEQDHADNSDERTYIPIIAIPTTLSVAETTQNSGYTENGKKVGKSDPALVPRVIIYDAELTLATPERLWLSTGMRAVDHAVEICYRPPDASPALRASALGGLREMFYLLPACKKDPKNIDIRQRLQIASFDTLWPESRMGALGLSHGLGHALGATYSIGHGITSCLTLAGSIQVVAQQEATPPEYLLSLADALNFVPPEYRSKGSAASTGLTPPVGILALQSGAEMQKTLDNARQRGVEVGRAVQRLVDALDLRSTLAEYNVPRDDISHIASHATRAESGPLHDAVVSMLEGIYEGKAYEKL